MGRTRSWAIALLSAAILPASGTLADEEQREKIRPRKDNEPDQPSSTMGPSPIRESIRSGGLFDHE